MQSTRIHDLQAALSAITFVYEALRAGYRFDDTDAEEKIESFGRHLEVIRGECAKTLESLKKDSRH